MAGGGLAESPKRQHGREAADLLIILNMTQLRFARSSISGPFTVVLVAALVPVAAQGQEQGSSPWYLGASQAFTRDSNILRQSTALSDTVSSTGVRAGIDQSFGRQRAVVGIEATRNRYNSNTQYNNTEYGANGRLDWATIERVSGTLSAQTGRSLYRTASSYTGTARNLQTTSGAALQVLVGVVTRWSFDGSLSTNRASYSATSGLNVRQHAGGLGLRYQPSEALSLRIGVRRTEGTYGSSTDFTRNDIDFDSSVELSGASRLNTRISLTETNYVAVNARDFRGWTGSLGWNWRPTGKLQIDLVGARDNSAGSVNQYFVIANDYAGDTRVSNSVTLRGAWELTSKIALNGSLGYTRRTLDNSFLVINGNSLGLGSGKDALKTASLSLRYLPLRNVELGCGVNWDDRSVNTDAFVVSGVTYAYTARSYSCSGQIYLR